MANRFQFDLKPRSQAMMYDMEYMGTQMLRDPNRIARVINKFAGTESFLNFFTQFGISTTENGAIGISANEKTDESLIRWRIKDDTIQASRITDDSLVPQTVRANIPFFIFLNDNWVEKDAQFISEDSRYMFYVRSKQSSATAGYKYEMTWVSNDPLEILDRRELLNIGRYLNYIGNAKGELSTDSQPIKMDGSMYDMFNITQVARHQIAASGHALSTHVTTMTEFDQLGKPVGKSSFLPFDGRLLQRHLGYIGSMMFYAKTNFDAKARKVLTYDNQRARPEVPMTSGIQQQMQWTTAVGEYSPFDEPKKNMELIDAMLASRMEYFRDPNTVYLIITGMGGTQVLEKVKQYKMRDQGINIQLQMQNDVNKQIKNVGFTTLQATYTTTFGTFSILNTEYLTKPRGWKSEEVGYFGGKFDREGFDMYIIPLNKMDDGRRTIRLATKAKEGINRGLVIGTLPGMSGMNNGGDADILSQGSINRDDVRLIQSAMAGDRYKISSATDGEIMMALSEFVPIVEDPDSIYWLKAKFPY